MSTIAKVLEALIAYDAVMQKEKDSADQEKKTAIEIERQTFYAYIGGYAAGKTG